MNRSGRLPGFIVVGAQKAGTTSLHVWLDRLPGVCMPRDKETNFFSDDARFKRGIEWYCSRFNHCDSKAVLGEVSPEYLFSPVAAERIHGMLPDIRLIFIFREPVQRAYSQYLMSCRKGLETLGFCEALIHEEKRLREHPELSSIIGYMKRSRYCEQVRRYLKYFRRNQCLFLKFESLVAGNDQTREVLEAIAEFIGIEAEDLSLPKENPASIPRWPWLQQALYSSPFWKRWIRVIVPAHEWRARLAHRIDVLNQMPIRKTGIDTVPASVIEQAMEETNDLEMLTGLDLADWRSLISQYKVQERVN